ncbi:MAG TPA: SDR family NAD(P)-dependent oxidoreductase [Micromonosporaceae bacterium]|nr:SDR family NAD(P)-dependent oxidoreductase [Micromonosporaceae bacterium]
MGERLAGKRALVTGAGSGIGRAVASRFAAEGAQVAVVDIAASDQTALAIRERGGQAIAIAADVTSEERVAGAFAAAREAFGGLDVVVANAAVQLHGADTLVHELDLEAWQRTIAVNLTGAFLTCKYGVRALLEAGGGSLICTGSPTGLFGKAPEYTAYSASKAGVHGMARAIAIAYADRGVRCNVVLPGFTATPLVGPTLTDEQRLRDAIATVPLGRPGTPADVAAVMVFLASDEAAYVTGAQFTVDGGHTAQ